MNRNRKQRTRRIKQVVWGLFLALPLVALGACSSDDPNLDSDTHYHAKHYKGPKIPSWYKPPKTP
ncbi:hypothetical protein AA0472_0886 [Acetobacter estunensis NRIC 0472]|uniref:Lipoprotein n=1 Tax=Acetobacter estunensis TaxID=104097 RepID=A0A967B3P4_9PROT|nr:hypothetical protein [Acetobacter estunensis]NHO52649.1 hypothetical protein [Acetobacter estunensis]GBQ22798.1 hypothetical protein AA0472_0886 [Acetobacter estunensis NRIC 0472]